MSRADQSPVTTRDAFVDTAPPGVPVATETSPAIGILVDPSPLQARPGPMATPPAYYVPAYYATVFDSLSADERREVDHHLARVRALNMGIICPSLAAMIGVLGSLGVSIVAGFLCLVGALTHLCTLSNPQRSRNCCTAVGCQMIFSIINAFFCVGAIAVSVWVITWSHPRSNYYDDDTGLYNIFFVFAILSVVSCTILLTLLLVLVIELHWIKGVLEDASTSQEYPLASRYPSATTVSPHPNGPELRPLMAASMVPSEPLGGEVVPQMQ